MSMFTGVNAVPPFGFVQPWFNPPPAIYLPGTGPGTGWNGERLMEDIGWLGGVVATDKLEGGVQWYMLLSLYRFLRVYWDDYGFPQGPQLGWLGVMLYVFKYQPKWLSLVLLLDYLGVTAYSVWFKNV